MKNKFSGSRQSHGPRCAGEINKFSQSTNLEDRLEVIENISKSTHPTCPGIIGDMYLEIATDASEFSDFDPNGLIDASFYLQKAVNCWNEGIGINSHPVLMGAEHYSNIVRSARQLALYDIYAHDIISGDLPDAGLQKSAYLNLLEISNGGLQQLDEFKKTEKSDFGIGMLRGELAEIETMLLLQRFGIAIEDSSWWPYFSSASEQYQPLKKDKLTSSSDIVIKSQQDQPLRSTAYRLQVKTSYKNKEKHNKYTDSIALLDFSELGHRLGRITQDITAEISSDDKYAVLRASDRLDKKTEIILNLFDEKENLD